MAIQDITLRPLELGPYPRVPNVFGPYVPHEYYQCGDPDWCLHESAPPENEEFYTVTLQTQVPPNAPKLFNAPEGIRINPDLPAHLQSLGFTAVQAVGFAIAFYDGDIAEKRDIPEYVDGYYKAESMIDSFGDEWSEYPIAVHVRNNDVLHELNSTLHHEIGHVYTKLVLQKDHTAKYFDEKTLLKTRLAGLALTAGGTAGFTASMTAELPITVQLPLSAAAGAVMYLGTMAGIYPAQAVWQTDKEERFCNRFARKHRDFPILLKD